MGGTFLLPFPFPGQQLMLHISIVNHPDPDRDNGEAPHPSGVDNTPDLEADNGGVKSSLEQYPRVCQT